MSIKVALADDHPMLLEGLCNVLNSDPDIEVTAVYSSGKELLDGVKTNLPDVLLLDLQLPDKTGQELAVELMRTWPSLRILILSGIDSPMMIKDMMKQGCRGYLLKAATSKQVLLSAVRSVYEGHIFLESGIKEQLLEDVLGNTQ